MQTGDVVASSESHNSDEESHVADAKSHVADAKSHDSDEESHDKKPESHSVEGKSGDSVEERYSYMQRGFTSEIFKIEINNIPPHVGYQVCTETNYIQVLFPVSTGMRLLNVTFRTSFTLL